MSVLMAIHSYPGANATLARHWPFFQRQQADYVYGVGTVGGGCEWPEGMRSITVGDDKYIDGPHLPNRMLETISALLTWPWRVLILCEYDTLFLKPIPAESIWTAAAHLAGHQTWGSKASWFAHNPWVFSREAAIKFLEVGRQAILEGICPDRDSGQASTPECSPDVFFGYVIDKANIPCQFDRWSEYSRNSFDVPGHLEEARQAYRDGVAVIHGIKTEEQLAYIQS